MRWQMEFCKNICHISPAINLGLCKCTTNVQKCVYTRFTLKFANFFANGMLLIHIVRLCLPNLNISAFLTRRTFSCRLKRHFWYWTRKSNQTVILQKVFSLKVFDKKRHVDFRDCEIYRNNNWNVLTTYNVSTYTGLHKIWIIFWHSSAAWGVAMEHLHRQTDTTLH